MTRAVINVTPLIDVLLVLLIIFMIITPVKPSRFQTTVPQEPRRDQPPRLTHPDTLIVSIGPDLELSLNREAGLGSVDDPHKLVEGLKYVFAERAENHAVSDAGDGAVPHHVFIHAPRTIEYGSVVKVIDAVKIAGADPIALQVDDLR